MAQRHEAKDSLDDFPTPPWATRALMVHVIGDCWRRETCLEPACGRGYMAEPLLGYFGKVIASDISDYGYGEVEDFLCGDLPKVSWIITNPPFRLALEFADYALGRASIGVAIFARLQFIESVKRHAFFEKHPLAYLAPFAERVPLVKGRVDPKASSATAYAWFVWNWAYDGPPLLRIIPPCRKQLERDSDYD